ncbi:MAG TPA: phospholipase C, phosphocholine-specific [Edaphobacter sp.]
MKRVRSRREFLRLAASTTGAAAGLSMLPPSIARALSIPAHRRTGTIQDVQHVVILMQENRSFDHYFGSMRGVRGFNDPRPMRLADGKPIWYQPTATTKTQRYHARGVDDDASHVLPFYLDPQRTTEHTIGGDHGWSSGHLSWNHGRNDQWINQKQDVITMGYLKRQDVSYHYALADAFTVCDAYFCSVHANTAPNRIVLWSGTLDPRNVMGKKPNGPGLDERHKTNGYTWTSYPERLEKAGVSWKLYQGGTGEPNTPTDNYTDNSLEFFAAYQVGERAAPDSPLVQKGVTDRTLAQFREDAVSGKLAQVTWIVAPYKYSEHPEASPSDGAHYVNTVLEALTANPEVWSKTVFIINYYENDVFFDHVAPPVPPATQSQNAEGLVSDDLVESLKDEFLDIGKYPDNMHPLVPGADPGGMQPIGLGPRLPMLVVSPWSKGGWVCSQVFDHTSVLQFLEARFGVAEPNISKWRRSVCGDLTAALDFASQPDETPYRFAVPQPIVTQNEMPRVPRRQAMPEQENGTRPARALPYSVYTEYRVDAANDKVWVDLINEGKAGAAFYIYSTKQPQENPRRYTVSAGQRLSDYWPLSALGAEKLSVYGPNGYLSEFCNGEPGNPAKPDATLRHDPATGSVHLTIHNGSPAACTVKVGNAYYTDDVRHFTIAPGKSVSTQWALAASAGWFDLSVTAERAPKYLRRFAGHLEDGKPSISDPAVFKEG